MSSCIIFCPDRHFFFLILSGKLLFILQVLVQAPPPVGSLLWPFPKQSGPQPPLCHHWTILLLSAYGFQYLEDRDYFLTFLYLQCLAQYLAQQIIWPLWPFLSSFTLPTHIVLMLPSWGNSFFPLNFSPLNALTKLYYLTSGNQWNNDTVILCVLQLEFWAFVKFTNCNVASLF